MKEQNQSIDRLARKRSVFTAITIAECTLAFWLLVCATSAQVLPAGVSTNQFTEVARFIEESEYEIRWQEGVGAFQSPNRANNLPLTYFENGLLAQSRAPRGADETWTIGLELAAFGKPGNLRIPERGVLAVERRTARAVTPQLTIEYENGKEGMRQDFIVAQNIGEGPLWLEMRAHLKAVDMEVAADGDFVHFASESGEVMRYADLKVWDANGTVLPARFVGIGPQRFAIIAEDEGLCIL